MTTETLNTETRSQITHPRELTEHEKQLVGDYITSISTSLPTLRAKSSIIYQLAEVVFNEGKIHCWLSEHEVVNMANNNKLTYRGTPVDYFDLRLILKEAFRFGKKLHSGQFEIWHRNSLENGKEGNQLEQHYWFDLHNENLRLIEAFIERLRKQPPLNGATTPTHMRKVN